ncbi:hypothetical protein BCL90_4713 [Pedobacter alluvionis]|uniref:Uncharacterized protein n=1 Tax=Pedobacter alluvionis TaxID=475253 RepID=A0A497XX48_9SPHI|nr:hypothetical protein BCL90_4713 [Pedobacter alluvionis]
MTRLFLTYLFLYIVFLASLNFYGELHYFRSFKIDILGFADTIDLLISERVFSITKELAISFLMPLVICLIFIGCSWAKDTCSERIFRNLCLIIGLVPFILFFCFSFQSDFEKILVPFLITLVLFLFLWIVLFHVRLFQLKCVCIHLFLSSCIFVGFFKIASIDRHISTKMTSTKVSLPFNDMVTAEFYKHSIFLGSTEEFDFYYDISNGRGIIEPKSNM